MNWRIDQNEFRRRLIENFDQSEVDRYAQWQSEISADDDAAFLDDLNEVISFVPGMQVLDVGAGTGAMCRVLLRQTGLVLTALEPVPAMLERLMAVPAFSGINVVSGFCDNASDENLFAEECFDVIVSRQVTNGLFDPVQAFKSWQRWLMPTGRVVIVDGIYDRSAWSGRLSEDVDILPLSTCRNLATIPYLLEQCRFKVLHVGWMTRTNQRPSTRTPRFMIVAEKGSR